MSRHTDANTRTNGRLVAATAGDSPAYYIRGRGRWRDIRAVLHPPYTAWHLSYVVLGAVSGPHFSWSVLGATLAAFFLAVGVAAHALDELRGRPLRTELSTASLVTASVVGVTGAVALGVAGTFRVGPWLLVFIGVGAALVVLYSLELLGGLIHNDLGFALAWGGFPVLTASFAENHSVPIAAVLLAVAATLLSAAQRALSTPARTLRRRTALVEGRVVRSNGAEEILDRDAILAPLEQALRYLAWATVALAAGLLVARALHWNW
jgi:hypothetical protein